MEMTKFRLVTAKVQPTMSHSDRGIGRFLQCGVKQSKPGIMDFLGFKGYTWWVKILLMPSGVPETKCTESSQEPGVDAPSSTESHPGENEGSQRGHYLTNSLSQQGWIRDLHTTRVRLQTPSIAS